MGAVSVHSHVALPSTDISNNAIRVEFPGNRIQAAAILSRLNIPESAVAFISINGVKAPREAWAMDGDEVSIFPVVIGG